MTIEGPQLHFVFIGLSINVAIQIVQSIKISLQLPIAQGEVVVLHIWPTNTPKP